MTSTHISNTITALLIDPVRAEARKVALTINDGELALAELYALIGCDLVERLALDERHLIWTDENGWDEAAGFTAIDGGVNAIAGRFLIVGESEDGQALDVAADVSPILGRFLCHRCLFEAEFVTRAGGTDHGFVIQTKLQSVTRRMDKRPPRLLRSDD
ncbi:MAG: DUF3846 domain-containing protein [Beijerinckiaceae bacterium]